MVIGTAIWSNRKTMGTWSIWGTPLQKPLWEFGGYIKKGHANAQPKKPSQIWKMIRIDGVQGRSPPKMLLWHINCFELTLPKKQPVQGHSGPHLFPSKQDINLPCEMYPPCTRREKASLSLEIENLGWEACLNKPCYSITNSTPSPRLLCHVNSWQIYCFFV